MCIASSQFVSTSRTGIANASNSVTSLVISKPSSTLITTSTSSEATEVLRPHGNPGRIAGGAIGAVTLVAISIILSWWFCCRHKTRLGVSTQVLAEGEMNQTDEEAKIGAPTQQTNLTQLAFTSPSPPPTQTMLALNKTSTSGS